MTLDSGGDSVYSKKKNNPKKITAGATMACLC